MLLHTKNQMGGNLKQTWWYVLCYLQIYFITAGAQGALGSRVRK